MPISGSQFMEEKKISSEEIKNFLVAKSIKKPN